MVTNPKKFSGNLLHDSLYEEILTKVKLEADPKYEADYLRNRAYFIEQQKAKGGLFEEGPNGFIAKANHLAKNQGYANYAELRVWEKYKVSVADYKKIAATILAGNKPKIEQTIKEMRPFMDPNRPAWELNMYYLHEEKRARAMKVLGLKEEPTLLDKEAVEVVKAFYKNMGFDVDHPPLDGKVILDLWAREKKAPSGAYQVPIQFGRTNVLMTTYKPDKGVSLDDFSWQLTPGTSSTQPIHQSVSCLTITVYSVFIMGNPYLFQKLLFSVATLRGRIPWRRLRPVWCGWPRYRQAPARSRGA